MATIPNDSTTGGYLVPSQSPIYDDALEDLLQAAIVGITGIDPTLVRPRWQPEPPNQPDFTTNWIAIGVTVIDQDTHSYQGHDPSGMVPTGVNTAELDEVLEVFCSFYGPASHTLMSQLRDGLAMEQNRWLLKQSGIHFKTFGKPVYLPALLKQQNVKRVDCKLHFTRRIQRVYAVRTVTDVSAQINNAQYLTEVKSVL